MPAPGQQALGPYGALSRYLMDQYLPELVKPLMQGLSKQAGVRAYPLMLLLDIEDEEARDAAFNSIKAGLVHGNPEFLESRAAAMLENLGAIAGAYGHTQRIIGARKLLGAGAGSLPGEYTPFESIAARLRESAGEHARAGAELVGEDPSVPHRVLRGIGQAPSWLAEGLAATAAMGPAGFPVVMASAAARDPETGEFTGVTETLKGAVKGAFMHGIGRVAGKMQTFPGRAAAGGTGFATLAALEGAEDKDVAASFILGGGMQALSPKRASMAERAAIESQLVRVEQFRSAQEMGVPRPQVATLPGEVEYGPRLPPQQGPKLPGREGEPIPDLGAPAVAIPGEQATMWQAAMNANAARRGGNVDQWAGNLNLDRLLPPGVERLQVMEMMQQYGGAEAFYKARRGTRSWDETIADSEQHVYRMLGESPKDVVARRKAGTALNAEELAATEIVLQARMAELSAAYRGVKDGKEGAGEFYIEALSRTIASAHESSGAIAEAGRALNILKAGATARKRAKAAEVLTKRFGGKEQVEELAHAVSRLEDPAEVMAILKMQGDVAQRGLMWKGIDIWLAGLLSAPATHKTNIQSNALFSGLFHGVEQPLEVAIGMAKVPVQKALGRDTTNRVYAQEALAQLYGLKQGMPRAVEAMQKAWREDSEFAPHGIRGGTPFGAGEMQMKSLAPFRMLTSEDAFFKASAYYSRLYGLGMREAIHKGVPRAARYQYVEEFVQEVNAPPRGASNARKNELRGYSHKAMERASELTFTNDVGKTGKALERLSNSHPLMKTVLAFVRTPINVSKQGIYRSPGVALLAPRTWSDLAAGGQRQNAALARMTAGGILAFSFYERFLSGETTGASSPEGLERELERSRGIAPFSNLTLGVADDLIMQSYARLEPLAMPVALAGTLADWHQRGLLSTDRLEDIAPLLGTALAENIVNKSYLQGPQGAMGAASEPGSKMDRHIEQLAGSTVPSAVNAIARARDLYRRDQSGVVPAVMARIPGLREKLPVMYDLAGRQMEIGDPGRQFFGRMLAEYSTPLTPDPILDAMAVSGSRIQRTAQNLRLSPEDFRSESDPEMIKDALRRQRETMVEMTPAQREYVNGRGNKAAHDELLLSIPELMETSDKLRLLSLKELEAAGVPPRVIDAFRAEGIAKASIMKAIRDTISESYLRHRKMAAWDVIAKWREEGRLRKELDRQLKLEVNSTEYRSSVSGGGR